MLQKETYPMHNLVIVFLIVVNRSVQNALK